MTVANINAAFIRFYDTKASVIHFECPFLTNVISLYHILIKKIHGEEDKVMTEPKRPFITWEQAGWTKLAADVARLTPADRTRLAAELRGMWTAAEPAWKKSGPAPIGVRA